MAKQRKPSERVIAYQAFFSTDHGKIVLGDLQTQFHAKGHTVGKDPYESYLMMGERNVVLYIWKMLGVSHKEIELMLKEERDE